MRILVTGPRGWVNRKVLVKALDEAATADFIVLVHGGAKGLDTMAHAEGVRRGWVIEVHEANWTLYGKKAGGVRNQEMADAGATVCLAFLMPCEQAGCKKPKPHDTHGTADCMNRAKDAGIPVWKYE